MAYEQREGDIAVFQNDKKGNDKAPDWKGTALINGVKMEVAFWQKSDTMLAGKVSERRTPPFEQAKRALTEDERNDEMHAHANYVSRQSGAGTRPSAKPADEFEDEIPFSPMENIA